MKLNCRECAKPESFYRETVCMDENGEIYRNNGACSIQTMAKMSAGHTVVYLYVETGG